MKKFGLIVFSLLVLMFGVSCGDDSSPTDPTTTVEAIAFLNAVKGRTVEIEVKDERETYTMEFIFSDNGKICSIPDEVDLGFVEAESSTKATYGAYSDDWSFIKYIFTLSDNGGTVDLCDENGEIVEGATMDFTWKVE